MIIYSTKKELQKIILQFNIDKLYIKKEYLLFI